MAILRFLVRRILLGLLVIWIISVAVFVLFFAAPHNVARLIAGQKATPQVVATINHNLGLDQPLYVQYGHFLWKLLHGNLGYSYYSHEAVTSMLLNRLPVSLSLVAGAAVIWALVGISTGVLSAVKTRSLADRSATVFALIFYSMPTFLLGIVLLYFFFYQFHVAAGITFFPAGGYVPFVQNPGAWAQHLILPWVTLALVLAATYVRLTRGSMLDVLGEDYIRTARSKGIRERRVIFRHGLRSGLTPVVTQFGIDVGTAVGGVLITETIFNLHGLGQLAIQSVTTRDLPAIIGVIMLASAFVVVANIIVDFIYVVLDPRVRLT
ncbi:MAG: ABC transporter permease [Streptosporangiaceae bacterium]